MSRVGVFAAHDLPAVVVELPDQGGVACKGLWCGQLRGLEGPPVASCSPSHTNTQSGCLLYVRMHMFAC